MYDRYSFSLPKEKITRRFEIKVPGTIEPQYNISPGNSVAIITDLQPRQLTKAIWGISENRKTPINKVFIKQDIQKATPQTTQLLTQRCIILADGFYLWKKVSYKSRIPYRITLKWNMPFAFAGVWQYESQNNNQISCAMITTDANELIAPITTKMPLMLPLEQEKIWLQTNTALPEILSLIKPYSSDQLRLFPVSGQINQLDMNIPEVTLPSQPTDQFGNYVLFE
ncbi:SOS response-associated peptidase [Cytophagaceae bacterium DM2B3-1]|uniref:Abasic site processing protein n=1 Tax=Xanthocytophaga flava TaxID=3048013 RepID=A0ABT7CSS3_9BACT|nr:SOS response-associated peptidase [Xanthocytophaga flavus]MDJ1496767.1 SOS response-associated peptidase [Xanthocytophaga flavus]